MQKSGNLPQKLAAGAQAFLCLCTKLAIAIWKGLKITRRWINKVIVDKAMRAIVRRYDRQHNKAIQNDTATKHFYPGPENSHQIDQLQAEIEQLRKSKADYQQQANGLADEVKTVRSRNEQLSYQLNMAHQTIEQHDKARAEQIRELQSRINSLLSRTLPKDDIPSMVYYAEADASGQRFRRVKTQPTASTAYRLITMPGDATTANFEVYENANAVVLITNRNDMLLACDISGMQVDANAILTTSMGIAKFISGSWHVERHAVINIIKKS